MRILDLNIDGAKILAAVDFSPSTVNEPRLTYKVSLPAGITGELKKKALYEVDKIVESMYLNFKQVSLDKELLGQVEKINLVANKQPTSCITSTPIRSKPIFEWHNYPQSCPEIGTTCLVTDGTLVGTGYLLPMNYHEKDEQYVPDNNSLRWHTKMIHSSSKIVLTNKELGPITKWAYISVDFPVSEYNHVVNV